jgi:hypothetical protein
MDQHDGTEVPPVETFRRSQDIAHQLQGPAGMWWSHFRTAYPENAPIAWYQFTAAFRGNYIPPGLMAMKVSEFMRLTQGTQSVVEYKHAFNNLSRYTPDYVDIEAKNIASFKRGLSPKMMKSMGISSRTSFNVFVSDCLTQENNNNLYAMPKGRKRPLESGISQPRTTIVTRSNFRPMIPGARFHPPPLKKNQQQGFRGQKAFKVALLRAKTGPGSSTSGTAHVKGPCYKCGQMGHFTKFCPRPKNKNDIYPARVHLTTVDEINDGEHVMVGTFLMNDHLTVVLFDSRSSHSFMSTAFAHRFNQSSVEVEHKYRISSAGAEVFTNRIVRGATLKIEGREFRA